ncbi:ribose transport system substrate-binding protein [Nocardioides scoriae]|uniref:Ribose transport system substrate-binding protein n=1 Tax=Nocardioides scoriae TaxID=642780 RepID=A0A1H1Y8L0_9ACTN|nr:substrate-binding domain-containing protein [Nocardioides scoriae]SDT17752.1 ribose transport system substrate-binding protein [Nocardioides scoriae]
MRTPHRSLVALALGGSLVLAGCGSSSDDGGSGSTASGGDTKVAAVIKGLDNPFFQAMEQGIDEQADQDGVDATVQAAQSITDTTGQSDKLTALAQQDYGCFVVNPISGSNLVNGLARISASDTPVVNIDSPVDADAAEEAGVDIATYIGTDNTEAGGKAGDEMVEAVSSGKVALVGGISGDVTSNARLDGFTQAVDGKLDVVQTVAADWERQKALTAATTLMQDNPDLKGFFAANDDMGLGIVQAVKNAGKADSITVISVDGNKDALQSVKDGDLHATVAQYPYAIGQLGVQACEKAAAGDDLPAEIVSPTAVVTSGVADQALAKFPAPFESFDNPLD